MALNLKNFIKSYHDFPVEGICFWDTTEIYQCTDAFKKLITELTKNLQACNANYIAAIEAKGFPIGGALAYATGLPLLLIRKENLIPGTVNKAKFKKEYGYSTYETKTKTLDRNKRVYLVYDILAEIGATLAAQQLIQESSAALVGAGYVVELEYLQARAQLQNLPIYSAVKISHPVSKDSYDY